MFKRLRDKWNSRALRVRTFQVGHKLFIMDGYNSMRYVDLKKNKVHVYRGKKNDRRK